MYDLLGWLIRYMGGDISLPVYHQGRFSCYTPAPQLSVPLFCEAVPWRGRDWLPTVRHAWLVLR